LDYNATRTTDSKILPDPERATLVVVSYLSLIVTVDRKKSKQNENLSDLMFGYTHKVEEREEQDKWLKFLEKYLRYLKFKRWRQKAVDREEWASIFEKAKTVRGR
jgi:hypothetical protein